MWIGSRTKPSKAQRWVEALDRHLLPGEVIQAVSRTSLLRPMLDGVVVTNARLLGFYGSDLSRKPPARVISLAEVGEVSTVRTAMSPNDLQVTDLSGVTIRFCEIPKDDIVELESLVAHWVGVARQEAAGDAPSPVEGVGSAGTTADSVGHPQSSGQLSPDGRYWWSGTSWQPVEQTSITPKTADDEGTAWYRRKWVLVAAAVLAVGLVGNALEEPEPTTEAASSEVASEPEEPRDSMPFVVNQPLNEAWAAVEAQAAGVKSHDMSLKDRYTGSASSADKWKVCTQSVEQGEPYQDQVVDFGVVRLQETCISDTERAEQVEKQQAQEAREKARRKAREKAQRAREKAAAERRRQQEARKPVLDSAALSACSVLAQLAGDVTTKQDRSDMARAFNYYARSSSEPKIVEAGENLTDSVDSWTGFMWDGSVALAAEVCIDGGAG